MSAGTGNAIESPCVSVCVIDAGGDHCTGCFRTLTEIAAWPVYSAAEKRMVLERVRHRRHAARTPS